MELWVFTCDLANAEGPRKIQPQYLNIFMTTAHWLNNPEQSSKWTLSQDCSVKQLNAIHHVLCIGNRAALKLQ